MQRNFEEEPPKKRLKLELSPEEGLTPTFEFDFSPIPTSAPAPAMQRSNAFIFDSYTKFFSQQKTNLAKQTRTQVMQSNFPKLPNISADGKKFDDYDILTSETNSFNKKIAYVGASLQTTREILLLNPNSEKLIALYSQLRKYLRKHFIESEESMLEAVVIFIRQLLHTPEKKNIPDKINEFLHVWLEKYQDDFSKITTTTDDIKIPIVPIEEFIENKFCFCRHYSLLTAFLLSKLTEDNLLNGEVFHQRSDLKIGPHSWVIVRTEVNHQQLIYIVDTTSWEKIYELKTHRLLLIRVYGKEVVDAMVEKYANKPESSLEETQKLTLSQ